MQKHKDIYTLNRENPDAIIYLDSDGKIIRLTKEDFSSEEEFHRWKEWSDQQYQHEMRQDKVYRNRKVSLLEQDQSVDTSADLETLLLENAGRMARSRVAMIDLAEIQRLLTIKQFRRLWLYGAMQMTEEEIARFENTSQQAISKSLRIAIRRIHRHTKRYL